LFFGDIELTIAKPIHVGTNSGETLISGPHG